jgi:aldose 1-epimerase
MGAGAVAIGEEQRMADTVELAWGAARVRIDPDDGGRLTSLNVAGHELIGGIGRGVVEHGSFLMAPWAGRIRDGVLRVNGSAHQLPTVRTHPHAGHGLVLDRPWRVLRATGRLATLRVDLDDRWPFAGHMISEVRLADSALIQTASLYAHEQSFPATLGWHPWFPRVVAGAELQLSLTAEGMLVRDRFGIPDGRVVPPPPGPWDDCFVGVRWPVILRWPGVLSLAVDADTDHLVVFDEKPTMVCVEPQTGPPDGPNWSPRMVTDRDPLIATTTWTWRLEQPS